MGPPSCLVFPLGLSRLSRHLEAERGPARYIPNWHGEMPSCLLSPRAVNAAVTGMGAWSSPDIEAPGNRVRQIELLVPATRRRAGSKFGSLPRTQLYDPFEVVAQAVQFIPLRFQHLLRPHIQKGDIGAISQYIRTHLGKTRCGLPSLALPTHRHRCGRWKCHAESIVLVL